MKQTVQRLARPEILELAAYQSARSLTTAAEAAFYLDANEGVDATRGLARYPDPQPAALLAAAGELFGARTDSILMVRGVDEAIDLLLRAFCRPGLDRVVVTPPTYGMYAISARIQGARVVEVPQWASATGFSIRTEDLLEACAGEAPKLVFLCSPNNPTGSSLGADQVTQLCRTLTGRGLVVLDEAYVEFSALPSLLERLPELPNLVVLRTLSKAWSAAGARFGMAFADPAVIALLQKVRAPYPLSTPAIAAVAGILSRTGLERMRGRVADTRARRELLARDLRRLPIVAHVFPSDANFLLVRTTDAQQFLARCAACNVVVRDRSDVPGLEDCVRISVGEAAALEVLLAALRGEVPAR